MTPGEASIFSGRFGSKKSATRVRGFDNEAARCLSTIGWLNADEVGYSAQVSRKAGAEEESLQSAIKGGNSDRIMKAIEALPDPPKKAMSMIEGDWQAGQFVVKWL